MSHRPIDRTYSIGLSLIAKATLVFCGVVSMAVADPRVSVTNLGPNEDGNLEWSVDVTPDASLFNNGQGSLAAELGFEVEGSSLVNASLPTSAWPFELPGLNPFTGIPTAGLATTDTQIFVSLGSDPVSETVQLLTFTTSGEMATTISWGDYEFRPGQIDSFTGGRLAQGTLNFDRIMGSISSGGVIPVCDPNTRGDLDGDGTVSFADFLTLSANFGTTVTSHTQGDIDCDDTVGFADFLTLSANFGTDVGPVAVVPEPQGPWLLSFLCCIVLSLRSQRRV